MLIKLARNEALYYLTSDDPAERGRVFFKNMNGRSFERAVDFTWAFSDNPNHYRFNKAEFYLETDDHEA